MGRFLKMAALVSAIIAYSGTAPAQNSKPQAPAAAPTASEFVGSETCANCHDEEAKKFPDNPHSKLALAHDGKGVTCESCHGPGKAHSEDGDAAKIFNPAKATAKKSDALCLGCHADQHPNFDRSPHAKANVGCVSCHSVHASVAEGDTDKAQLLKASQPRLCFQCHNDVKPAFDMPFHHKVNEGLVKCSDCHDTHGTFDSKAALRSTADQNAICTRCHTDTRGPFVFEHVAVKTEGCVGCHTPHGSQNARLLNMPSVNTLCNQCHSPVANSTVHGMNAGSQELAPCVSCHTFIHGSNVNPAFLR
jgi:DmsE family decaheme c-type cytochrome